MPIISCVMPLYNDEAMVQNAILSVVNQDVSKELIIIDDASTDGSADVVAKFIKDYDFIKLISLPNNMGQSFARNFGAMFANGKYITFLDSDDEHLPEFYATVVAVLEQNPNIACIDGAIEYYGALSNSDFSINDERLAIANNTSMINKIMRKAVFNLIGGFPANASFRQEFGGEDAAFVQVLKKAFICASVDKFVAKTLVKQNGHFMKFINSTKFDGTSVIYDKIASRDEISLAIANYADNCFANIAQLLNCFNLKAMQS